MWWHESILETNLKYEIPRKSIARCMPKRAESRNVCRNAHSSIIHNVQKAELSARPSTGERVSKMRSPHSTADHLPQTGVKFWHRVQERWALRASCSVRAPISYDHIHLRCPGHKRDELWEHRAQWKPPYHTTTSICGVQSRWLHRGKGQMGVYHGLLWRREMEPPH